MDAPAPHRRSEAASTPPLPRPPEHRTRRRIARLSLALLPALLLVGQLGSLALRAWSAPAAEDASARESASFQVGDSSVDLVFAPGRFAVSQKRIEQWIENSAQIVRGYYGQFPVPHVRIRVIPRAGRGVGPASTYGPGDPHIRLSVGQDVDESQLVRDWVMVHEFIHTAFPWMNEHDWLEEGLATYVEPIARGQAGQLTAEQVWEDLLGGMPQGLPKAGDRGIDLTPTWGRTYWGGALFCFAAEIEIRRRTDNRHGLQDALRGVLARGGNIQVEWPIEKSLQAADEAVGVPVLTELYERWRADPVAPDLEALGKELGMQIRDRQVTFDDAAPLAALRRAITAAPAPAAPEATAADAGAAAH